MITDLKVPGFLAACSPSRHPAVCRKFPSFSLLQAKAREAFAKDQERVNEHSNQVDLIRATLAKAAAELSEQTHEAGAARTDLDDKR